MNQVITPPMTAPATPSAATWKAVCRIDDIPALGARRVIRAQGIAVALFRAADDHVFALLDHCPHKGGPLSQGIVFGHNVACPLHNWTIGLDDGCAKDPDAGCTVKFSVKVDGGQVFLDPDELATLGLAVVAPVAGPTASTGALGDGTVGVQAPHTP